MFKTVLNLFLLLLSFIGIKTSWACVGCGQTNSYTPKILLAGTGFVLLPLAFASYIGWRIWQDHQHSKNKK